MSSSELKPALEAEVARFKYMYPQSCVRFAEVIGKRISHVAGCDEELHPSERRVRVNDTLVMFVQDREGIPDHELERFALQVAVVLSFGRV